MACWQHEVTCTVMTHLAGHRPAAWHKTYQWRTHNMHKKKHTLLSFFMSCALLNSAINHSLQYLSASHLMVVCANCCHETVMTITCLLSWGVWLSLVCLSILTSEIFVINSSWIRTNSEVESIFYFHQVGVCKEVVRIVCMKVKC